MKTTMSLMAFCLAVLAPMAGAHEYPLQFTANPGYRGLVVAGYQFVTVHVSGVAAPGVEGNCSYYTVSGGSGKGGGGGQKTTHYYQTCTWDMQGNLVSTTPQNSPVLVPHPLYTVPATETTGMQVIYAVDAAGDVTGTDSRQPERGFVNTQGAHFTWLTPMNNAVVDDAVRTIVTTLKSDGDSPVTISAVSPGALNGSLTLKSTTCLATGGKPELVAVGKTCTVTVTYDPTKITVPAAAQYLYDTIHINITSDAGASHNFIQNFTIVLPRDDN